MEPLANCVQRRCTVSKILTPADRNNDLIIGGLLSIIELCDPSLQKKKANVGRLFELLEKVACGGGPVEPFAFLGAFLEGLK